MNKTAVKVLVVALLLYAGSFLIAYIGSLPPSPDEFVIEDPPYTIWNYLSLLMLLFAVGCTIAAIKLRKH